MPFERAVDVLRARTLRSLNEFVLYSSAVHPGGPTGGRPNLIRCGRGSSG